MHPPRPEGPRRCPDRGNAGGALVFLSKFLKVLQFTSITTGYYRLLQDTTVYLSYYKLLQVTTCYYRLL